MPDPAGPANFGSVYSNLETGNPIRGRCLGCSIRSISSEIFRRDRLLVRLINSRPILDGRNRSRQVLWAGEQQSGGLASDG